MVEYLVSLGRRVKERLLRRSNGKFESQESFVFQIKKKKKLYE